MLPWRADLHDNVRTMNTLLIILSILAIGVGAMTLMHAAYQRSIAIAAYAIGFIALGFMIGAERTHNHTAALVFLFVAIAANIAGTLYRRHLREAH